MVVGVLLLVLNLFTPGFGPPVFTDGDDPARRLGAPQVRALAVAPTGLTARAVLIMDRESGRVVWERNGRARVAPASTTKIMTALLAIEKGGLKETIVVQAEDLRPLAGTGSSVMGLQPGDRLTLEDLLWGLMLPSGNDAAVVVARGVAGSVPAFVALMNTRAQDLGLRGTHFANPHGLDDPQHYTTAEDLASLARHAMQDPLFRTIVGTERTALQASRQFAMVNTNRLLAYPDLAPGVDGVKTGTTGDAGDCVIASVTRGGRSFIIAVMGSRGRNPDAIKLIDYAYATFSWLPLPPPAFATLPNDRGATATRQEPIGLLAPWDRLAVDLRIDLIRRGGSAGSDDPIATVTYLTGVPVQTVSFYRR
ncbi:MAG: D-alanyl-D-alanine carboxypeptidase [Chloroflexi bacterium]|nr:D-alanyl-D-alanine carboxypeptidase [Chloroflexota bacterium]